MTQSTTEHQPYSISDDDLLALGEPATYAKPTDECDLIMKGGITSGVIYPLTACQLARKYHLRRLGGASAGAIAAAFAAAAELGREQPVDETKPKSKAPGFVGLQALPADMGENLFQLFQPAARLRTAYALLATWIEPDWGTARKIVNSIRLIVGKAPLIFVGVTVAALLPVIAVAATLLNAPTRNEGANLLRAVLVFLPGALLLGLVASAGWLLWSTLRRLPEHGFGLCDGHTRAEGYQHLPLTDWMAQRLNTLAGRPLEGAPLTFGDLWGQDATDSYRSLRLREQQRAGAPRDPGEKRPNRVTPADWRAFKPNIDVLVMTTALTFGRPYQFPFTSRIFFFCPACLQAYFPEPVVTHLVDHSTQVDDEPNEPDRLCPDHGVRVRHVPAAPDLPVVIAARLSLSFPILISAVPLYCVDWNRARGKRELIKVWFSDGGIASNFPMHFFDNLWPERPTFGINLAGPHPDSSDLVWRAANGSSGTVPRSTSLRSVAAFAKSMMNSMQNWGDNTQLTLPGFRDRVVEVRTNAAEGGLNLRMKPETITGLARRGAEAAVALNSFDFDLHRWVRYRASMAGLNQTLDGLHEAHANHFGAWLDTYQPTRYPFTVSGRKADRTATKQLLDTAANWQEEGYPALEDRGPKPVSRVRQTPPL